MPTTAAFFVTALILLTSISAKSQPVKAYVHESASTLAVGNEQVEIILDRGTGYFSDIWNRNTGVHHKVEGTGAWPFGLRVGTLNTPDLMRVDTGPGDRHHQKAATRV